MKPWQHGLAISLCSFLLAVAIKVSAPPIWTVIFTCGMLVSFLRLTSAKF